MKKIAAFGSLLWRFPVEVALSGWSTGGLILTGGQRLKPGFARMSYGEISETGAVVLGLLITLTPGTTTVDIDSERRELLLHLLDTADIAGTLDVIRRRFAGPVSVLFKDRSTLSAPVKEPPS
ncbi:MAG: Na+/H+ antiporter subunit E [Gammaproteobacteria bacterium]|nr:Na+/H+ antiporter subunit E [Gammaproteobacteria bacterium]